MTQHKQVNKWLGVRFNKEKSGPVEILIYDQIGSDWFTDSGVNAKDFAATLKEIPEDSDITVRINSPGGNVWDGLAMFHMLLARGAHVTTRVDGVAASIASVIFQAGAKRIMPKNALQMIHRASGMAVGNAEEMRKMASDLEAHDGVIAGVYADRTGMDKAKVMQLMEDETWMSGEDSIRNGFCNECSEPVAMAACADDLRKLSLFRRVPEVVTNRGGDAPQNTTKHMPETITPVAAPVAAPVASPNQDAKLDALINAVTVLAQTITDNVKPQPPLPANIPPVTIIPAPVQDLGSPLLNAYEKMRPGAERQQFAIDNFSELSRVKRQAAPQGNNTISSNLYPNIAIDALVVTMRNKLALLKAFTTDVRLEPMKPLVPVVVTHSTVGPTVQTDATDFTSGNSTLTNITVTPHRLSSTVHLTDAQLNNGIKMASLSALQAGNLADAINDVVTALMITGTYGTALTVGAAANFTADDLAPVLGAAKNYGRKTLLLDGGHLAYLLPTNRDAFRIGEAGAYGFDSIIENNRWTGATTNTCGFVCSPTSIVCAAGQSAEVPAKFYEALGTATIENGMSVRLSAWFDPNSQITYSMMDLMFGAAAGDTTAAELLITA